MSSLMFFVLFGAVFSATVTQHPLLIVIACALTAYISYHIGYDEGKWEAENPNFEETLRVIDDELESQGK